VKASGLAGDANGFQKRSGERTVVRARNTHIHDSETDISVPKSSPSNNQIRGLSYSTESEGLLPVVRRAPLDNVLSRTLRILDKSGLMTQRLATELLIATARRRARLNDFGDEAFREPLRRLLDCCESEARLNNIGKLTLAEDILQLLINCLQIQRDRHNWPRIGKETIVEPLFILGLPRTGTTLLHSLLAQDHEAFRAPTTWEVMFPSPPPSFGQKGRVQRTERRLLSSFGS
jgi:hypothetical protein